MCQTVGKHLRSFFMQKSRLPVCEVFAARVKAGPSLIEKQRFPCGYRVENQAGERAGVAKAPRPGSQRPAEPTASRLFNGFLPG